MSGILFATRYSDHGVVQADYLAVKFNNPLFQTENMPVK